MGYKDHFLEPMAIRAAKENKDLKVFWAQWSECKKRIFVDMKEELDAKGYGDYEKLYLAEIELQRKYCESHLCDFEIQ